MTKAEQLQRAIDWIIENKMEDRFCTVSLHDGRPRISFVYLHDMIAVLRGMKAKVSGTGQDGYFTVDVEEFGMLFSNSSFLNDNIAPGTYTLDESLLKAELVG
jgi:hypothetical protein